VPKQRLEKFEDTKGIIGSCKSKKDRQWPKEKGQRYKQRPTKHRKLKMSNTNPHKKLG
jgi:hypothetical protein